MSKQQWLSTIVFLCCLTLGQTSLGDRSLIYNECLEVCQKEKCRNKLEFKEQPSLDLRLMFWTCKDDCGYFCMWKTVKTFTTRGHDVPQFHGKWPFIRIFGIQEPASVLFSLLNLHAHGNMYLKFIKATKMSAPMYFIWTWFAVLCLHGWLWSTIFHARDKPFTEVMDYSCAFSMTLTLLYCFCLRIICKGFISKKAFIVITALYGSIFYNHLQHLWSGRIHYGYNMTLNVAIGLFQFLLTLIWWYRNHKILPHVHLFGWFVVSTVLVTVLELADFPPFFWIFDAHSLWHASTIPLVKLLYRFITLDCSYLRRQRLKLEIESS